MTSGVCVTSYETIELCLLNTNCHIQVTTLEIGIELYLTLLVNWSTCIALLLQPWILLAYHLDGLFNSVYLHIVFLSIFPKISIVFMQLNRINMSRTTVHYLISWIRLYFLKDSFDQTIFIGQRNGARR